jgi:hypothetical protein
LAYLGEPNGIVGTAVGVEKAIVGVELRDGGIDAVAEVAGERDSCGGDAHGGDTAGVDGGVLIAVENGVGGAPLEVIDHCVANAAADVVRALGGVVVDVDTVAGGGVAPVAGDHAQGVRGGRSGLQGNGNLGETAGGGNWKRDVRSESGQVVALNGIATVEAYPEVRGVGGDGEEVGIAVGGEGGGDGCGDRVDGEQRIGRGGVC